ncbi:helix-turn-helix domain-containing protein [Streptomyces sp. NPDC091268]|uniref:helix-turn-helix domain-containing protein n=1 Tax=Streptomyces sp. NPDC091268 TaxID=3365979 RepID=UPI00382C6998
MAAAERGVWTGTQLRRLLAERAGVELSPASVSALFTKQPAQVKLSTLAALCTALGCAPGDLLILHPTTTDTVALAPVPTGPRQPEPEPRTAPAKAEAAFPTRSLPPL